MLAAPTSSWSVEVLDQARNKTAVRRFEYPLPAPPYMRAVLAPKIGRPSPRPTSCCAVWGPILPHAMDAGRNSRGGRIAVIVSWLPLTANARPFSLTKSSVGRRVADTRAK